MATSILTLGTKTTSPSHTPRAPRGQWATIPVSRTSTVYAWPNLLGGTGAEMYEGNNTAPAARRSFPTEMSFLQWVNELAKASPKVDRPLMQTELVNEKHWLVKGVLDEFQIFVGADGRVIYSGTSTRSKLVMIGYRSANTDKKYFAFNFPTQEQREDYLNKELALGEKAVKQAKEEADRRKATKDALKSSVKVGDIYYRSWGYSMTIVNFYQITSVKGCKFTARELQQDCTGGGYQGECWPAAGNIQGKKELKGMITNAGRLTIEGEGVYLWDGRKMSYNRMD